MTSLCRHLSAQEIVNWVTTADGCVHTDDADATKQFRPVGVGGVYWALCLAKHTHEHVIVILIVIDHFVIIVIVIGCNVIDRCLVYISPETREAISKAKASAAETDVEDAGEEEMDFEGGRLRNADGAPGAHGVGLDEPMEAAVPVRHSPRRQQVPDMLGMLADDSAMDRIGALDNAAKRVMVRIRAASFDYFRNRLIDANNRL